MIAGMGDNAENGFCVFGAKARGHRDLVTVVGHAATIAAGEWITASGEFRARFLRTSVPSSIDGIEKVCHGARLVRSSPQAGCSAALRPHGDRAAFRGRGRGSGRRASQ
jgi:exodeoxyribonuclease V alpha subunit